MSAFDLGIPLRVPVGTAPAPGAPRAGAPGTARAPRRG